MRLSVAGLLFLLAAAAMSQLFVHGASKADMAHAQQSFIKWSY